MHDKEIQYFVEGLQHAQNEFYLDAIKKFNSLIDEFPDSDLADDASFNVGLCYFKMKQIELAIESFNQTIANYPEASISSLDNANEFGKTAAKCHYTLLFCYLELNKEELAIKELEKLRGYNHNSYVIHNGKKLTFEDLAKKVFS